ncbi:MAG TPA: transglutaminase family protein [Opitutaceae bacterium]|jgi:transglutaminase-like putative cysteine protease|nr:transglutaminase family protein [Opitutaceae bacterium]
MKLRVTHLTRYEYAQPVAFAPHRLYLRPRETPLVRILRFAVNLEPASRVIWIRDEQDNPLGLAYCWDRSAVLSIRVECEVETLDENPFDFILDAHAVQFPFSYLPTERFALLPYLAPPFNETQSRLRAWLDQRYVNRPADTVTFLTSLNQLFYASLDYVNRADEGIQPSVQTLDNGSGSCRDFAILFIESCRTLGLAARFVSGYLFDPEARHPDHGAMHAWAEVFLPGAGWKGFDPTHGVFCNDTYIPCAHAAQADTVNPVQGSYHSTVRVDSHLHTSVLVEKIA